MAAVGRRMASAFRSPPLVWAVDVNEHEVDSARVLELVHGSDRSADDYEFVALAMTLGIPLVSMDGKLLKAFPGHAVALSQPSA